SRATCPGSRPCARPATLMAERKLLVSGNWKMHHNHLEAIQVVQKLAYRLDRDDHAAVDVSVHPAFTALRSIQTLIDADDIPIALGAQDCHWEDHGAFTGEVSPAMLAKLVVAYEPIWAIGTGRTATPDDAQATCALVRATVADLLDADAAAGIRVQYGGSVKAGNAADLMAQPDVDGALVGGASLDPDEFAQIVRYARGA